MPLVIRMLNVNVLSIFNEELLEKMNYGILITPNLDHLVKLQKDREFYNVYQKAEWIVCDSKILLLASKFIGTPVREAIPGSSFFPAYCDFHKDNSDIKIFLLGAAPGVADKAMEKINERIGRSIIIGSHSPSFGFEKNDDECEEIIRIINSTDATVLVVGVGAPKQEKWIYKYKDRFTNIKLFMALGATIDFEAGNIKRAPKIFQNLGLEWFYRLIKEPRRLWKRYLIDDMPFFYYLLKQKFGWYINPFEATKLIEVKLTERPILNKSKAIAFYIREGLEYWGKFPALTAWLFGTSPTEEIQIPEELLPDHLRNRTASGRPAKMPLGQTVSLVRKEKKIIKAEPGQKSNVG